MSRDTNKVDVYMRVYVREYIADTRGMSLEQKGAYSDLLFQLWQQRGPIPLDHDMLWRLVGADNRRHWEGIWVRIKRFFSVDDAAQTFTQKRIEVEREKAQSAREKRSDAGAKGGRAKAAAAAALASSKGASVPSNARGLPQQEASTPLLEPGPTLHPSSVIRQPSGGDPESPAPVGKRITGHVLRTTFAAIRATEVGGSLPWLTPRSTDGKAETFAEKLAEQEVSAADVEATIGLMFRHIRAGADGWGNQALRDPSFAFAAWMSSFTALLEEHRGLTPKPTASAASQRQGAAIKYPEL